MPLSWWWAEQFFFCVLTHINKNTAMIDLMLGITLSLYAMAPHYDFLTEHSNADFIQNHGRGETANRMTGYFNLQAPEIIDRRRLEAQPPFDHFNVSGPSNAFCNVVLPGYVEPNAAECQTIASQRGLEFRLLLPIDQYLASGCFSVPLALGGRVMLFASETSNTPSGCPVLSNTTRALPK